MAAGPITGPYYIHHSFQGDLDSTREDRRFPIEDGRQLIPEGYKSFIYINGILNERSDAVNAAKKLSEYVNSSVVLFYNPTQASCDDVVGLIADFMNVVTKEQDTLRDISGAKMIIFAHSHGAYITLKALKALASSSDPSHGLILDTEIITFGPATLIKNSQRFVSRNYIHINDLVSIVANMGADSIDETQLRRVVVSLAETSVREFFHSHNITFTEEDIRNLVRLCERFINSSIGEFLLPLISQFLSMCSQAFISEPEGRKILENALRGPLFLKDETLTEHLAETKIALQRKIFLFSLESAMQSLEEYLPSGTDEATRDIMRLFLRHAGVVLAEATDRANTSSTFSIVILNNEIVQRENETFVDSIKSSHSILDSYLDVNNVRVRSHLESL
jgi:hypothetical protein